MSLNDDIGDIENPDGICLLTFIVDNFLAFFYLFNKSYLRYSLKSNILVFSEGIRKLQKSLLPHIFLCYSTLVFVLNE